MKKPQQESKTYYDQILDRLKNIKLTAWILIIVGVFIGAGTIVKTWIEMQKAFQAPTVENANEKITPAVRRPVEVFLSGTLINELNEPLPLVSVEIPSIPGLTGQTDSRGKFLIKILEPIFEPLEFHFSKAGYKDMHEFRRSAISPDSTYLLSGKFVMQKKEIDESPNSKSNSPIPSRTKNQAEIQQGSNNVIIQDSKTDGGDFNINFGSTPKDTANRK